MSRQETDTESSHLDGPRATPMRDILKNKNATTEQKFSYWRDAMPDALSDGAVMKLMKIAAQNMGVAIENDLNEADNPNYFGGSSVSAIPGTPEDLNDTRTPAQKERDAIRDHKQNIALQKWMGHK